ncbi:MAG TPA: hypothetical protein DCQ83_06155, partial [Fibrobacteres bacterium]|nr:hypothetical protein [Fibrobacterota bacterium]
MPFKPVIAGMVQVPSVSGGGGVVSTDVAYIDPANGNDTSGDGTASHPYATAQKAYDEGFVVMMIGVGDAGPIDVDSDRANLYLNGMAGNDWFGSNSATDAYSPDGTMVSTPKSEVSVRNLT